MPRLGHLAHEEQPADVVMRIERHIDQQEEMRRRRA
jgi:hypothetical protein